MPERGGRHLLPGRSPAPTCPARKALEGYDGASSPARLCTSIIGGPQIDPQIELAKAVLAAKTPLFGSCWGLQVITVAAGGSVRKNPKGREIGFGRRIRLTAAGRGHPMYAGKDEVFNSVTVHLDEVESVAPGTQVLSSNLTSAVQSAEIRVGKARRLGHAISSGIYARRYRGDLAPLRQDTGRGRLLPGTRPICSPMPRSSTRSMAIPRTNGWPGGTGVDQCSTRRSAKEIRTGSRIRCGRCARSASASNGFWRPISRVERRTKKPRQPERPRRARQCARSALLLRGPFLFSPMNSRS